MKMKQLFVVCVFSLLLLNYAPVCAAALPDIASLGPHTERISLDTFKHVHYVSADVGSDEQGDGSKAKPWKSVFFALNQINGAGETSPVAVLVAEGVYDQDTVYMKPWVSLFGGYSESDWSRDIEKHRTILSGVGVRRVVIGADNAWIDGFCIKDGLASGPGAGILCDDVSPTITNNCITNNWTLEPPDFKAHRIHQDGYAGGAIACFFNAHPVITNNLIADNGTGVGNGGAVVFHGWIRPKELPVPQFKNNVVINNISGRSERNPTRSSSGGGIAVQYEAAPVIEGNLIAGNRALGLSDTGGIFCEYAVFPKIIGNWIVGNRGDDDGGGIYVMRLSEPTIEGNLVAGNASRGVGGIRLSKEGRALVTNNLVACNLTGGGVLVRDGFIVLKKNIIVDNKGGVGFEYRQDYKYFGAPVIEENIIWGNELPGISAEKVASAPPIIRNNVIEGGYDGEGNSAAPPNLAQDGGEGEIGSVSYSPDTHTTTIKGVIPPCAVPGRVVFVGSQASVIKSRGTDSIELWGRLSTEEGDKTGRSFEVMSTYGFKGIN